MHAPSEPTQNGIGWLLIVIAIIYFVSAPGAEKRSQLADMARRETYTNLRAAPDMPLANNDHFWRGQCELTLLHPQDFEFNPVLKGECQRLGIIK